MKNPNICTVCGAENKSGDIQCIRCGLPCGFYAATPQPQPTAGLQDVLPEVIKDLRARDLVGRQKYGTTLQIHNGRQPLVDAYQEALDQVMYLKQALMEQGSPYPVWNWPETVFARQNTPEMQFLHVLSEVDEVDAVGPLFQDSEMELHMEMADLFHSNETYWRIIERTHGMDYVAAVFQAVENKNRARGYYDIAEEPQMDSVECPAGVMPYEGR